MISLAEFKEMRLNSRQREVVIPKLDPEALIWDVRNTLRNCRPVNNPPSTYDEALQTRTEELLARYEVLVLQGMKPKPKKLPI